ncbi:MAG: WXG100 family type VII secretion target [Lachnospiraceae bacterium]|nr:WXG100 family type VII secretion target [Lachnospiraceae bacterium]
MESIKVTPENLRSKATEVDAKAEEYYAEYRALLNDVATLTSSDWTGEEASEFLAKVNDFEDDFNKMRELMQEYANHLRTSATNYEDTQNSVRNQIKSLQS